MALPEKITSEAQLEDLLSEPTDQDVATVARLEPDILILGAGGKMGPSLARRVRRAAERAGNRSRVLAVSRFSSREARETGRESARDKDRETTGRESTRDKDRGERAERAEGRERGEARERADRGEREGRERGEREGRERSERGERFDGTVRAAVRRERSEPVATVRREAIDSDSDSTPTPASAGSNTTH